MAVLIKERTHRAKPSRKFGKDLYLWRRSVGLNRVTFAGLANVSERCLATYEKRKKLSAPIRRQVNEASRLVKALLKIIPPKDLLAWLHKPNSGFGGRKPWALIQDGELDVIWEMIHQTRQGSFA